MQLSMKRMRYLLVIALATAPLTHAFSLWPWASRTGRQVAEAEISEECIEKAEAGDCQFFTCFDERHPCSRHNWALSYGWRYCTRYDQEYQRFTNEGKTWITGSRLCTMQSMLEFYHDEHINCEDVEYAMKEAHSKCESDNGVCNRDMVYENREALLDIYKLSRKGLIRFLLYLRECGGTEFDSFLEWLEEQRMVVLPYIESVRDLLTYVSETGWEVEEWGLEIPEFEIEWPELDVQWQMPDWTFDGLSWYGREEASEAIEETDEDGSKLKIVTK